MTALPTLPDEVVPLSQPVAEIVCQVLEEVGGAHRELIDALLWQIDAANAESVLLGKDLFDPRGTLPREEFDTRLNLPPFLDEVFRSADTAGQPQVTVQLIWESYYNALIELGDKHSCRFMRSFVQFETGLRNAIAKKRAEVLSLDADAAQVLGGADAMFYAQLVLRAQEAEDPQAREMILDRERLALFQELEGIDPFAIDALLAYLASALVLDSWRVEKDVDPETMLEVFA
ncbi:hypothetical protein KKF84_20335 [Myxococcota bacterium]|nr:hypothetical protein [Myxococcota bacterium]